MTRKDLCAEFRVDTARRALDSADRPDVRCPCVGSPVMRKFVPWALLLVLPFSGIRVICIDSPTDVSGSSARTEHGSDCERLCPLHESASNDSSENDPDCSLSADASSLSVFASITIPRPQELLQITLRAVATYADSPRFYIEPGLAHLSPPPKPKVL